MNGVEYYFPIHLLSILPPTELDVSSVTMTLEALGVRELEVLLIKLTAVQAIKLVTIQTKSRYKRTPGYG